MNLNQTVFTIEKQQNLFKYDLDLIIRKIKESDDKINYPPELKNINNQGTTSGLRLNKNDGLEWSPWSTCSVRCGTDEEIITRICKEILAEIEETLATKDEIIRHLTSQQSALRNKLSSEQDYKSYLRRNYSS